MSESKYDTWLTLAEGAARRRTGIENSGIVAASAWSIIDLVAEVRYWKQAAGPEAVARREAMDRLAELSQDRPFV